MKRIAALSCLVLLLCMVGCHLKDYSRSYYLAGVDRFGQRVEIGATFTPPQARSMMETLERDGVFAPGKTRLVEVEEPLQPAATQLEILTWKDGTGPVPLPAEAAPMPPSSGDVRVWLTKGGALWVGSYAPEIAARRAAGWMDMPPPGYEAGHAPQWDARRGRWRVRKAPEVANAGGGL
jgi:hypothetical protein